MKDEDEIKNHRPRWDSNPQSSPPESDALSITLHGQYYLFHYFDYLRESISLGSIFESRFLERGFKSENCSPQRENCVVLE